MSDHEESPDSMESTLEYAEPVASTSETGRRRRGGGSLRGTRGGGVSKRGRGGGNSRRGARQSVARLDKERAVESLQRRKDEARALIERMPVEEVRTLCLKLLEREPGMLFDLLEAAPDAPGGYRPSPQDQFPNWCRCANCREMPTDLERLCCGCLPANCVSQRPQMDQLILDEGVLRLAAVHRREYMGGHNVLQPDHKKMMRHTAYRQFVLWRHGRLGAGNRRVIPSCVVWKIRDTFNDPFGAYTGFRPANFI